MMDLMRTVVIVVVVVVVAGRLPAPEVTWGEWPTG